MHYTPRVPTDSSGLPIPPPRGWGNCGLRRTALNRTLEDNTQRIPRGSVAMIPSHAAGALLSTARGPRAWHKQSVNATTTGLSRSSIPVRHRHPSGHRFVTQTSARPGVLCTADAILYATVPLCGWRTKLDECVRRQQADGRHGRSSLGRRTGHPTPLFADYDCRPAISPTGSTAIRTALGQQQWPSRPSRPS